jgi:hypothetical protein
MPDSRRFLFQARKGDGPWRTYVQDISEESPRPFSPEGYGVGGPVSPDGKVAILNSNQGWFLFPVAGGEAPRPIPGVGRDVDDVLRWDATGRAVYLRKGDPHCEIWHLDLDSGRQEKVATVGPSDTTGAQAINAISLTPDGKTYAYSVQRFLSTLYVVSGLR